MRELEKGKVCVDDPGGHEVGPAPLRFAAVEPVSRDPFPTSTRMRIERGKGTHVKEWLGERDLLMHYKKKRRKE